MQEVLYSRQQALIQRTLEDVRYSDTYRTYCCIRLLYLPGFYSQIFGSVLFYTVQFKRYSVLTQLIHVSSNYDVFYQL